MKIDDKVPDDLDKPIWGAKKIATVIGRNERMTFHLLETGQLPVKKVGGRYVSTPRALLRALNPEVA